MELLACMLIAFALSLKVALIVAYFKYGDTIVQWLTKKTLDWLSK